MSPDTDSDGRAVVQPGTLGLHSDRVVTCAGAHSCDNCGQVKGKVSVKGASVPSALAHGFLCALVVRSDVATGIQQIMTRRRVRNEPHNWASLERAIRTGSYTPTATTACLAWFSAQSGTKDRSKQPLPRESRSSESGACARNLLRRFCPFLLVKSVLTYQDSHRIDLQSTVADRTTTRVISLPVGRLCLAPAGPDHPPLSGKRPP